MTFRCPDDRCDRPVGVMLEPPPEMAACEACGSRTRLKAGALDLEGRVARCAVCGMEDLWVKKNFRNEYGCVILIVAALLMDVTYQLSLPAAVLLDLVLYQFLGDVSVCYRCKAEVRHSRKGPHKAYDLHHATHLDKEIHRAGGVKAFVEWTPGPVFTVRA